MKLRGLSFKLMNQKLWVWYPDGRHGYQIMTPVVWRHVGECVGGCGLWCTGDLIKEVFVLWVISWHWIWCQSSLNTEGGLWVWVFEIVMYWCLDKEGVYIVSPISSLRLFVTEASVTNLLLLKLVSVTFYHLRWYQSRLHH